jgi:hypothetical protein
VTAVPVDVSCVVLGAEVDGAGAWAERHGWELTLGSGLVLEVRMVHPADGGRLLLRGDFDGYRALPPSWLFVDPDTAEMTPRAWPSAGAVGGQPSMFHLVGIICANFNRRAYTVENGPHDWGGLTNWANVREGVHAENVGEMLAAIATHLRYSPGRMG